MGVDHSLNPDPRAHSVLIHRTDVVPTRKGKTTTRRPPAAPRLERAEMSGDGSVTRRCPLVGDPLDDEQWCDDLTIVIPSSR